MSNDLRDVIVDAAFSLAAEKPWTEITLVAIAEASGVSLAELAQQVSGKAQILEAFARRMDGQLLAARHGGPEYRAGGGKITMKSATVHLPRP